MEKVNASKEKHDDFASVVTKEFNDSIPPGSVLDGWLIDSEHGAEMLYHLAKNPDEMKSLLELKTPFAQARRLTKIEEQFTGDSKPKAPAQTATKASKPVSTVSGRATAPDDPVLAAAKDGDFRAYKQAANDEDIARFKSR